MVEVVQFALFSLFSIHSNKTACQRTTHAVFDLSKKQWGVERAVGGRASNARDSRRRGGLT